MATLNYSTCEINRNFKIKVSGESNGTRVHKLVGVRGLVELVGIEMSNKLLLRAFGTRGDKEVCKLRRGLKVTFYCC